MIPYSYVGGDDGEGDFFFNQSEVYGHLPTVNDDDDDENNADDDAGDSDEKSAEAVDVDVAGGMNKLAVE